MIAVCIFIIIIIIYFARKMPVYKPEGNKLVIGKDFWMKNELFQSLGIRTGSKCP